MPEEEAACTDRERGIATARGGDQERRRARREGVIALGLKCGWHSGHAAQVARLAAMLYDQVQPPRTIALLPGPADEWLEFAALLHDIGYIIGVQGHHKEAARIIREAPLPGLLPHEVALIALTVRCHRKRWPGATHKVFAGLGRSGYETVRWLTALLRVADALDRTHENVVRELVVTDAAQHLGIGLIVAGRADGELWAARRKSDVLASVLDRPVFFRVVAHRDSPLRE